MEEERNILKRNLFYFSKLNEFVQKGRLTLQKETGDRIRKYISLKEKMVDLGEEADDLKRRGVSGKEIEGILKSCRELEETHLHQRWLERPDEKERFLLWLKENSEVEALIIMELETNLNILNESVERIKRGLEKGREEGVKPAPPPQPPVAEGAKAAPAGEEERKRGGAHPSPDLTFVLTDRDREEMREAELREKRMRERDLKEKMDAEKRVYERVPISTVLNYRSEDNLYVGWSMNISEGGVFVATFTPLSLGATVDLKLQIPDGRELHVEGVVRWIKPETGDPRITPGMGIQFLNLTPEQGEILKEYVKKRKEMGGEEPIFFDDELFLK